jgi:tRNA1(Val) A37 N6-methylase TrmN6
LGDTRFHRQGADHEAAVAALPADEVRNPRQARGVFYTPQVIVDFLVDRTLRPLLAAHRPAARELRILDPACGCGAFLLGVCRWTDRAAHRANGIGAAKIRLEGIDVDPAAVALASAALSQCGAPTTIDVRLLNADALAGGDPWQGGGFDAIVGNPPYVNIRKLARYAGPSSVEGLRRRFRCAAGAFDLYVLFIERAVASLREGGRLGFVVPNKLAALDYAAHCRELLLSQGTLDEVVDLSSLRVFGDADVYPYLLTWTKGPVGRNHRIAVSWPDSLARIASAPAIHVLQSRQSAKGLSLHGELEVELRAATVPLAELCTIHSGATGFQAASLASWLVERNAAHARRNGTVRDFIVSGNIEPYAIELGNVRFLGRNFARPVLPADAPLLSPRKRRLYAQEKIVLAGMGRRIEAAFDRRGLALGVQVYALADWNVDPLYLLGLLNSRLMSHLFRLRFSAKQLAGGYLSFNKGQLARLPIRTVGRRGNERRLHDRLLKLVMQRLCAPVDKAACLDDAIDEVVEELYRVRPAELVRPPQPSRACRQAA